MSFRLQYDQLMGLYRDAKAQAKSIHHCCIVCGAEDRDLGRNRCAQCQGAMDAIYNLDTVELQPSYNPLQKYFSLLPIQQREHALWLGEGNTPCVHATSLGRALGLYNLFLKDETTNPTRSTKDRIASVGLSRFGELGLTRFAIASTGNSSTAYARGVRLVEGFELHIFVGRHFLHRLNYANHPRVKTYVLDDDFVSAGKAAQTFATEQKIFSEGGFFSLSRREGLKLAYLEAYDHMPEAPQYVFQAVSSGMGLLGAFKGALEYQLLGRLPLMPKFIAVQQASCSPMAAAFTEGVEAIQPQHIVQNPTGIAEAILRGDPSQSYPYIHYICRATGGQILSVTEAEIRQAREVLAEHEELQVCFASATALAGLIKMKGWGREPEGAPILVNLTGANRPLAPVPHDVIAWHN